MTQQQQQQKLSLLLPLCPILRWFPQHKQISILAHENDRTGIGQVKFKKIKKQAEKKHRQFCWYCTRKVHRSDRTHIVQVKLQVKKRRRRRKAILLVLHMQGIYIYITTHKCTHSLLPWVIWSSRHHHFDYRANYYALPLCVHVTAS